MNRETVHKGCKFYPGAEEYMNFMRHLGKVLVNL